MVEQVRVGSAILPLRLIDPNDLVKYLRVISSAIAGVNDDTPIIRNLMTGFLTDKLSEYEIGPTIISPQRLVEDSFTRKTGRLKTHSLPFPQE